jgi:hypothetical protein
MTTQMTQTEAENRYKQGIHDLAEKWGGYSSIPASEWREYSEELRSYYLVLKYNGAVTRQILSQYMVSPTIIERVMSSIGVDGEVGAITPRTSRSDQYKAFTKWACEHDREQFTTDQLIEASGFSYQTTLKFVDSDPHFIRIKKGLYECRDYNASRIEAKKLEKSQ